MNYLGRPIYLQVPDWSSAVSRTIKYDLREGDIGFGAPFFLPTQDWTVNTWSFTLTLPDAAAIAVFDKFFDALTGPLCGFWLPVPFAQAKVVAGTSTSVFNIAGESFAAYWNSRPDVYLFFTFADGTQAAGKIQSVVADGANETVTLTAALPQIPDAGTTVCKLHYVRLAKDELEFEFFAENQMSASVDVIELPEEYVAAQTGLKPLYLFHFWCVAPINEDWYYTSFAAPVVSSGELYANFPLDFSNLQNVSDGSTDDLKIDAKPDDAFPFSLFFPIPFSGTLYVEVFIADYSNPDVQTKLFSGRVTQVEDDGITQTATCQSRLGLLARKLPRLCKGPTCQNVLFDQNTCKLGRAYFETTVNIVSIIATFPPQVVCTFLLPAFQAQFQAEDFLAQGQFEAGEGTAYEARTIIASSYDPVAKQLTLTLNIPLEETVAGVNAEITAGCDHTPATCRKFNNYQNFVGFIAAPDRNPVIKAVNANSVSQGGK